MPESTPFEAFRRTMLPLVLVVALVGLGAVVVVLAPVLKPLGALGHVIFLLLLTVMADWLAPVGSGWLRRATRRHVAQRWPEFALGRAEFVGLALASKRHSAARLAETDDDAGFLLLEPGRLTYRGGLALDLPVAQIAEVVPQSFLMAFGLCGRIRLVLAPGAGEEWLAIDSRRRPSMLLKQLDNRRLLLRLRAWLAAERVGLPAL